jgi:putative transposase
VQKDVLKLELQHPTGISPFRSKKHQNKRRLFRLWLGCQRTNSYVHSVDKVLEKIPCETLIRYHLSKRDLDSLQEYIIKDSHDSQNTLLGSGKSFHFAIDFINDPYYGEIVNANENYVIKSKMEVSTTKFHSYFSLYIVTKGQRLTLAVFPTKKGVPNVGYLRRSL